MSESNTQSLFDEFPPISTEEWEAKIKEDLNGKDYRKKLRWHTGEGIEPLPFYREEDLQELDQSDILSATPNASWEIRESIYGSTIEMAHEEAQDALQSGAEALQLSMELSVKSSTSPLLSQGLPLQNRTDFSQLLNEVPLKETPRHIDAGPLCPALMTLLQQELSSRSVSSDKPLGSFLFDPFALRLQHGISYSPTFIYRIAQWGQHHFPKMRTLGIDARLYHNSGGTIVQELAFALASAAELLATLTDEGLSIKEAANQLHFNFAVGSNYFLEIAKFRAFRLLWSNLLQAFDADAEQLPAYLHAETSQWNKTGFDPYTNMLRTSTEGMSAVLGECDALTVLPFDDSFRRPNHFSQRIARNSQIIMREEAYLSKVQDPAAGSYYIEQLTNDLAREAWELFQKVEERGGIAKAIEDNVVQSAIRESQQKKNLAIAKRGRIFVGTNQYPNPDEEQADELNDQQPQRPLKTSDTDIDPLNLDSISDALSDGAMLGDIASAIMDKADSDIKLLKPYRGPHAFEELRLATENSDQTPKVLNLPLGNPKARKARSAFSNNFFGCVGYDIEDPIGYENISEAVNAIKEHNPDLVVLCSSDQEYEQLVPALCEQLENIERKPLIVLAGYPKAQVESYREAGIDLFIHSGCNVLESLKGIQQKLNIIEN